MDSSEQNNPSDNPNNPPKNIQQKKGKDRQKTTNRRIENETRRQVTLSKRRTDIFKKAYEVGTLCGAENAVLVKSPMGKAHSFGFPSVEAVANKFLNRTAGGLPTVHDPQLLAAYNEELTNLESQLEWETNYKNESMMMMKEMQDQFGIPPKLDELNYDILTKPLTGQSFILFRNKLNLTLKKNVELRGYNRCSNSDLSNESKKCQPVHEDACMHVETKNHNTQSVATY